jgi:ribosomal-protein-alanine N-acetyltransferase
MTATEPAAAPMIRLLPVQATMHKVIAALHGRCFDDAWNAYTVGQVMRMPGAFGFLAVVSAAEDGTGDIPIGFALASGAADERELLSIGVLPDHRRAGIGRRLVEMVIAESSARGAARLFLEVAEDNTAAQRLYRSLDFIAVGRRPGYYRRKSGPAIAALTLRRMLTDEDGD